MSHSPSSDALGLLGSSDGSGSVVGLQTPPPHQVVIDGFEILSILGQGGMGVVYKARQHSLDRHVALKVIHENLLANRVAIHRFEREAMAAARLMHPNIVAIYQAGKAGNHHYLAMEYVAGTNLQRLVEEGGMFPVDRACRYIRQAALGLQHAHERGLVHRDIKPPNLMVTQDGALIKILDMGLARLTANELQAGSQMTQQGVFMGTPDFVAPEQAVDARHADIRADIYSLGCTFYYILTGQLPFPTETVVEKIDKHRWSMPTPAEQFRSDLPAGVSQVLLRMLAKKPADRFQTPLELAAALAPFAQGDTMASVFLPNLHLSLDMPAIGDKPSTADGVLTDPSQHKTPHHTAQLLIRDPLESLLDVVTWPTYMLDASLGELSCWRGHTAPVQSVAFLPNGLRVLSASRDGTLRVWDATTGATRHVWPVAATGLTCMALSRDGKLVLTGDEEQIVRVWDVREGRQVIELPALTTRVCALAISPDNRHALTGSGDGVIRLWDLQRGTRLLRYEGHRDEIHSVAFSHDGKRVISGSRDFTLRMWDTLTGQELRRVDDWLSGHRKAVITDAVISRNGQRILSAGSDHVVCLWNVLTGRMILRFQGHKGWVYSTAFSPNEKRFLSGGGDKTVRLWDLHREREAVCFTGHNARVTSVAFSPDGLFAVSGSFDQTIRLWRLPPG